jgi:VanZ family protein
MTEPTTAATLAAAASGITLALLGVDYYSLLGGLLGAMLAVSQTDATTTRWKSIGSVVLTCLIGSILGSAAVALLGGHTSRAVLVAVSLVCAAGAQRLVARLLALLETKIDKS